MRLLLVALTAIALTACGRAAEYGGREEALDAPVTEAVAASDATASEAAPAKLAPPGQTPVPAGAPMLAYSYGFGLEAPSRAVRDLIGGHEAACAASGPQQCQVVGSTLQEAGKGRLSGTLELRATPAWVKRFKDGLAGEAKTVGGRLIRSEVSSEDLSRQIVDTEARLRAMTTLRDRLQALLASRPGKLSDLVEIERELARVQGDIDSTQSQLAVMRGRVTMSEVTVTYDSIGVIAPTGVWSPLTKAFTDFLAIVVFTVAAMVRLIAWCLPWVAVGGLLIWLFRKRLPWPIRLRKGKTPPKTEP